MTHAGGLDHFLKQYGDGAAWLRPALESFTPDDVIHFAENLGQECFTGTSGKIFPVGLKATQLLRAWLKRLSDRGVTLQYRTRWCGFGDGDTILLAHEGAIAVKKSDAVLLLALGAHHGHAPAQTGNWTRHFQEGRQTWRALFLWRGACARRRLIPALCSGSDRGFSSQGKCWIGRHPPGVTSCRPTSPPIISPLYRLRNGMTRHAG